jgi:hypothetical protein
MHGWLRLGIDGGHEESGKAMPQSRRSFDLSTIR